MSPTERFGDHAAIAGTASSPTDAPPSPIERRHRPDVEGLRAVAVIAVVLYHAGAVGGGFVGVDVFFVLSGFLITGLLVDELHRTGRVGLAAFYARRARRLLPMAALVLAATVVAAAVWLSPLKARTVGTDAAAAAGYLANYRFAAQQTDYLAERSPSPVQHYWSLAVEEQFYLLWPVLLWGAVALAGRRSRRSRHQHARRRGSGPPPSPTRPIAVLIGAVAVASLAASLWLTGANQPWAFFSLPTRAWELLAGAALSIAAPQLQRLPKPAAAALGWAGAAAVAWSVVAIDPAWAFPGLVAAVPVLGAVAVVAAGAVAPRRGVSLLLSHRRLAAIGGISYGWYLWHWPVLVLAPHVVGHDLTLPQNLALGGSTGLLAAATKRLVEDPVRFNSGLARLPRASLALGGALTVFSLSAAAAVPARLAPIPQGTELAAAGEPAEAAAGAAATATPPPVDDPQAAAAPIVQAVAEAAGRTALPANLDPPLDKAEADRPRPFLDGCENDYTDTAVRACVYGDRKGATTIALFGDSHAAQWLPALEAAAQARHWRIVSVTKSVCPPLDIALWSPVLKRPFRECDQWRAAAVARIRAEHPAVVVLGIARFYGLDYRIQMYDARWMQGIETMVARLQGAGLRTVVLGATPGQVAWVPDCLSEHPQNISHCTPTRARAFKPAAGEGERAAATRAGGVYLDVSSWFCTDLVCPVVIGSSLVYRDDNHISTAYARRLALPLGAEVAKHIKDN